MPTRLLKKPVNRGRVKMAVGRVFFTVCRHVSWAFSGTKFSAIDAEMLPFECFRHQTPLIRELRNVDMYLQHNKVANLRIAMPKIHGMTIKPGETFSYWKSIGKPTKRKGYLKGMVLQNGSFKAGTGGGLCQLSNLIYWMTIHTPMTVTERHRHGYDVFPDSNRTQPFGSGATCFYNYGDLVIRNDTEQSFQLVFEITDKDLKGAWLSDKPPEYKYEVYEKNHIMQPEFWGGYTRHNLLYRKKFDSAGNLVGDEYVAENHAMMMYSPLLPE